MKLKLNFLFNVCFLVTVFSQFVANAQCSPPDFYDREAIICDDLTPDGITTFNRLNYPFNSVATYHRTQSEADSGANALPNSFQNIIPFSDVVYGRLEEGDCYNTARMYLEVIARPIANQPTPLESCGINDLATFDLSLKKEEINNAFINPSEDFIKFYYSEADANSNINQLPITYNNTSNPQTIYVAVGGYLFGRDCRSFTTLDLIVNEGPNISINDVNPDPVCSNISSSYDLTQHNEELVSSPSDFNFTYYTNSLDLYNDINVIVDPTNFILEPDTLTLIYVKIFSNGDNCYSVAPFYIETKSLPSTNLQNTYDLCFRADDTVIFPLVVDSGLRDSSHTFEWVFNSVVVGTLETYEITEIGQYTLNVENIAYGCSSSFNFDVVRAGGPTYIEPSPFILCDYTNLGFKEFDLSLKVNELLDNGSINNMEVSFFEFFNQASNNHAFPLVSPYTNIVAFNQTIYTRIENLITGCYEVVEVYLVVENCPIVCNSEPTLISYCYADNDITEFFFTSENGSRLFFDFISDLTGYSDSITIYDSDGSILFDDFRGQFHPLINSQVISNTDSIHVVIDKYSSSTCATNPEFVFEIQCINETDIPNCDADIISPLDNSVNLDVEQEISWNAATVLVEGYKISIGTATDNFDVIDDFDVGNILSYQSPLLDYETTYYIKVTPYNSNGDALDCLLTSFSTKTDPNVYVNCSAEPLNVTHCYRNYDNQIFNFKSTDGSPLHLWFAAGNVYPYYDRITIYDGDDDTADVLFNGNNGGDFSNLLVTSTGDELFMNITSNGSYSCVSNFNNFDYVLWDFYLGCANEFELPNCNSNLLFPNDGDSNVNPNFNLLWSRASFIVDGYKLSLGTTLDGVDILDEMDVGDIANYNIQSLEYDTQYYLKIIPYNSNGNAQECANYSFTTRSDPTIIIDCENGILNNNYCYLNEDDTIFIFKSSDGSPLQLIFNSGEIEGYSTDFITIYDGDSPQGTVLFSGDNEQDLANVNVQSLSGEIYLEIVSDYAFSCEDDEEIQPWDFDVFCTNAVGIIEINPFVDENQNGIFDLDEPLFNDGYLTYQLNNSGEIYEMTTSTGDFRILEENSTNSYNFDYIIYDQYISCYTVNTTIFENINISLGSTLTIDLPIIDLQNCEDLSVNLINLSSAVRGFRSNYNLIIENMWLSDIASGSVEFVLDESLSNINISNADPNCTITNNSNGFVLDFINLEAGESKTIGISILMSNILSLGDNIVNSVSYTTNLNDINPENDVFSLNEVIVGSYDPNDIIEIHGSEIVFNTFTSQDYLYYVIRFQNVGSSPAFKVSIQSTLDNQHDFETFQMLNSSHDYVLTKTNDELEWEFSNINLPSYYDNELGSHGFILYKIKPKLGYSVGDIIPNTADIYFDFNDAIVTNTFETEFVANLSVDEFTTNAFSMYPNPANAVINIRFNNNIGNSLLINIYDIQGKLISINELTLDSNKVQLDVSELSSGMYFVKMQSEQFIATQKIIIE